MTENIDCTPGAPVSAVRGVSPYATGGGGVTLERRVAALYLARLLTGATATELRGRRVDQVSFQQAPARSVDDLVVYASRDDRTDILELDIAVRRSPDFATSDQDTEKLLGDVLAGLRLSRSDATERRFAICVAGVRPAAQQVAQLVALARDQTTSSGFFELVRTPGRFQQSIRDRLDHLVNLVRANLSEDGDDASIETAERATWRLLTQLEILMPRLETPDETDWSELVNQLQPWARDRTVAAATALRDRLESLAASYGPSAAVVDLASLRRAAHDVLDSQRRRQSTGWEHLRRLDTDARQAVRNALGVNAVTDEFHLPRQSEASKIRDELHLGGAVLVSGESGAGKSALVLGELTDAAVEDPTTVELACLNLRNLPPTIIELRKLLGGPLENLLAEMSAPTRVLVLDAADATIERDDELLRALLLAARRASITPWVVSATDGLAAVRAVMENSFGAVRDIHIDGLNDEELQSVVGAFPQLRRLVNEPRARELLRRPAVVDLLVRAGDDRTPLSDADAFQIVWEKLVRNAGRTARGLPDSRDQVMRSLASQQLRQEDAEATYAGLDAAGVTGLQRDGLLRPADPWQGLPTFAHELLRTYAAARVLLSTGDPAGELIARGAPRWALPATRLAVQVLLAQPDRPESPLTGRFARIQDDLDRLAEAGYGDRWTDLPTEAVLTLPNAGDILSDAWTRLLDGGGDGLRRLLRVILQRHSHSGLLDPVVVEPLAELLLHRGWPSELDQQATAVVRQLLRGLALAGETEGHALRLALRQRLVDLVAAGDERMGQLRRQQAERLAARTPEKVAEDEEQARKLRAITAVSGLGRSRRRQRRRAELPPELTADDLLEQLALLGSDLGGDGEHLLRRVAEHAPHRLAPALEEPLTGLGLACYDTGLLIDLIEAYYIDQPDEDEFFGYRGMGDDGIRDHTYHGMPTPLSAAYRGPFLALLRADPRAGIDCLNHLLNHAARARAQILSDLSWTDQRESEDRYVVDLDVTGERRRYVGDGQVWMWYRGLGEGPSPCMSALQALELVCDEYIQAGTPVGRLVSLLLEGCENLAMPALAVGMLVRHLDKVGDELDPFLSEPMVWHLEFSRTVGHEGSGLAARTDGIFSPERRAWNLRDVALRLALSADQQRVEALREVGRRLVARAADLEGVDVDEDPPSEQMATVRGWANSLDRDKYNLTQTEEGLVIEHVPDEVVAARLQESNTTMARTQDATALLFRHPERFDHIADHPAMSLEDLTADLAKARDLVENPPAGAVGGTHAGPAAVAAAALEAHFLDGLEVSEQDLAWAAALLVRLLDNLANQGAEEDDYSIFGRGPDRAASRALPLVFLPSAAGLREDLDAAGVHEDAIARALSWVIEHGANEARLFLTRAFDVLWDSPCDSTAGTCHHIEALSVIEDTARDSLIGPWDPDQQRNLCLRIDGPVAPRLQEAESERVDVPRLTPTLRGAGAAAASRACCQTEATTLLEAALSAHRRGMLSHEHSYQHRANDAAAAARAVLDVAASGESTLLFEHLDAYSQHLSALDEFLRALAAAAEETQARAAAARDVWPGVLNKIIEFASSGRFPTHRRDLGPNPLAAAIPTPSYSSGYLHREYEGEPIRWPDVAALSAQIEHWVPQVAGDSGAVDALAQLLDGLPADQQAALGLPWMEQLVMADPDGIANRSFLLPNWLKGVLTAVGTGPQRTAWHRIVDTLTVAGDNRIAEMAD
jgi:hypothetical protein